MCAQMHVCTCVCSGVEIRGQLLVSMFALCLVCDRVSLLFPAAYARLAGPETPGVSAFSASHFVGVWGYRCELPHSTLCGFGVTLVLMFAWGSSHRLSHFPSSGAKLSLIITGPNEPTQCGAFKRS